MRPSGYAATTSLRLPRFFLLFPHVPSDGVAPIGAHSAHGTWGNCCIYAYAIFPHQDPMELADILNLPPAEAAAALRKRAEKLPEWRDLEKAYDPRRHPILDKTKYPDIITEAGLPEAVTRVVVPFQKLAVKRSAELCFALPAARSYSAESEGEREAAKLLDRLWSALRLDALNLHRARTLFACCEVATLWHAAPKATRAYGFDSPLTLRQRTFSPMDGHRIYPRFDAFGDLVALSVEYTSGGDTFLETLTASERLVFRSAGGEGWELEERAPHGLDKIPAVYISRPAPVWEDSSPIVEEIEWALSRNGNYLRRNAKPLLAVMHDKQAEDFDAPEGAYEGDSNQEFRSIFELPAGSSMQYVTWDGAPEALRFHYQTLRSLFFDSLQLPDWSHSEMKSTPMSGESRKQLYIDAKLKVVDESGALSVFLLREISVLKSFAAILRPELAPALESLTAKVEIQPYEISDERDTIQNLSQAKAAGLVSQREAIAYLGWSTDPDRTRAEIRAEERADAAEPAF